MSATRRSVPVRGLLLVILAAVGQVACLRNTHQGAFLHPPQTPRPDAAEDEAESHRRQDEWYKRRHPDGGMRQKAVEERQRLAGVTAGTSGQWNAIGPRPIQSYGTAYSGRVWGIAVDPRNSNVVYIGTDGGGVWKTTDGGTNWVPLTDSQANINIRDLALAPSSPDTIFAATNGGGILRSTDDGATWTTQHPTSGDYVLSVAVHPTNASIVLAGECGISRSSDGGTTWSTTLPVQDYSCLVGQVAFDPTNGSIAYAAMPDGLHRSTDGGLTWSLVGGVGLPSGPFRYATVAIAPSSSGTLYLALKGLDEHLIGFYRSVNSGATWTQVGVPANDDVTYWGWSLRVHPTNPNLIYAGSLYLSMSTDGGSTWARNDNGLHVDHHIQTYSPDGNTLYIGNDGGIWKTTTPTAANTSWANLNNTLNTAMFYPGISISPNTLNTTFGGTQDNGTLKYQGNLAWNGAQVCGDGGFTAIDFTDPQVVYASCTGIYGGWVWKYNGNSWSEVISGLNTQDRSAFIPPLVMEIGRAHV